MSQQVIRLQSYLYHLSYTNHKDRLLEQDFSILLYQQIDESFVFNDLHKFKEHQHFDDTWI